MKIISITGGVGSGKSEVLRVLQEEFDAEIIKADEVAHQLMEPGKQGYQHVVEALGDSFLNKDGSIDRNERHHPPDGVGGDPLCDQPFRQGDHRCGGSSL